MTVFEALLLMLTFGSLIVAILSFNANKPPSTKGIGLFAADYLYLEMA